ncbi:MAG: SMP-30/gluconolactonase/LRE family protein [Gammaproteobacteria bacterium]|nr:SMP-30/gluconolactonase/LRE family protein [Gammaproteobacteria bacterium]MCI0590978.1 SMP-30/gluconolactonase/LRE family protein [Gammaproteobacteria bacterium]
MARRLVCSIGGWLLGVMLPLHVGAHGEALVQIWETPAIFEQPESVIYDRERGILYVSNISGAADEKDGQGFLSKVSVDGEIIELEWVTSLNAPKGLALYQDALYVADIDTLLEIDVEKGKVIHRYEAPGAVFLNDVTVDEQGSVYVSDMMANTIYRLSGGEFGIWLQSPDLESPNGLFAEEDRLVVGTWGVRTEGFDTKTPGHLKVISQHDKSIRSLGNGAPIGNLDGVEADRDGDYYVTDWVAGELYHIGPTGKAESLLTLAKGSADLEYVQDLDLIVIPMMLDNKLVAYKAHHSD